MDGSSGDPVKLFGKIEKGETWEYQRQFFPSKLGGLPAWLEPASLPDESCFTCDRCAGIMTFVLQLYAPDDDQPTGDAFHRMLYLFVCQPCKTQWRAFRSQLPRKNDHYSFHPEKDGTMFPQPDRHMVRQCCMACGVPSNGKHYGPLPFALPFIAQDVSADTEWRALHSRCKIAVEHETLKAKFPEYLLIITEGKIQLPDHYLAHERELYKRYQKLREQGNGEEEMDESEEKAIESIQQERLVVDHSFDKFCKYTTPDDVIFYCRDAEPMWISDRTERLKCDDPTADKVDRGKSQNLVPMCELCGGPRSFEFQVLPQMLFHMPDANLDFASVIVYTCASSCKLDGAYKDEFVYFEKDHSLDQRENQIVS